MRIELEFNGRNYTANLQRGISLASPLGNHALEYRAWSVPSVQIKPVKSGDWTGSVEQGASVNFYDVVLNPHGNGTHTEGQGHIRREHQSLNRAMHVFHFICRFIRLHPEEHFDDKVVRLKALQDKWQPEGEEALIIATGAYPHGHDFTNTNPPYFEPELMSYVREHQVRHFLTDLPSVDKEDDGGLLKAHNAFWPDGNPVSGGATISEMLMIPSSLEEGLYLLNLQIPALENDAAPSRPVVYPLT